MPLMPFDVSRMWLGGLLSLVPLGTGVYSLLRSLERRRVVVTEPPDPPRPPAALPPSLGPPPAEDRRPAERPVIRKEEQVHIIPWRFGLNRETGLLLAGLGLIGWSLGGGRALLRLQRRKGESAPARYGDVRRLRRPDGTELHVECHGPPDGAPVVFVHGLGADGDEWYEIRQRLARRHRLIDWDLPGLGRSSLPADGGWSLERLARDLEAVLHLAHGRPAFLVGHSLGGMVLLTFCRLFPEALGTRVAGLVLAHTTYTNPTKTTATPRFHTALQKPVFEPLCRVTAGLSPLLRALCVLTYLNGSAHRSLEQTLFTGRESWEVLDFLARYFVRDRPAVVARMALAMFDYDETATLGTIRIPTLVVAGDRDERTTPGTHAHMGDHIPGARVLTLSQAKHGGLLEYPQQFSEAVEEFVSSYGSRLDRPTPP